MTLYPLYYQLPSENIVYLKFILESHEGIATLRTLDAEKGFVAILGMKNSAQILHKILSDIAEDLQLQEVLQPPNFPENADEDLLIEYLLK